MAVLGILGATTGAAYAAVERHAFAGNADGLTYGSVLDAGTPDQEPDLIAAEATNGARGYVLKSELDEATGADVADPAAALAYQADIDARIASGQTTLSIPVYLEDGATVVGEFEIALTGGRDATVPEP